MILSNTIIFIPKGETDPVTITIYVTHRLTGNSTEGYWVTNCNYVILSTRLGHELRQITGDQPALKEFFESLQKIEMSDFQNLIGTTIQDVSFFDALK